MSLFADNAVTDAELKAMLASLREWREAYYNGNAMVADAIYDDFEDRAREAAKARPDEDALRVEVEEFLAGVGAPVGQAPADDSAWDKAKHRSPMGSLNKAQNLTGSDDEHAEFEAWFTGCVRSLGQGVDRSMVMSEKLDGISIALYYVDGKLEQAVTRGDGEIGEDITRNVVRMKGVKDEIKGFTGDIRGEIILRHTDWKAHFPTYSNPRNAASGIAKRLDGQGVEHLTVLHYRLNRNGKEALDKSVQFEALRKLGLPTPNSVRVDSLSVARKVYERYVESARANLDYDIDGLVYEFNDAGVWDSLGDRNNRPLAAIAYKFPHEKKPTVLRTIQWQVGNTGRVTPVAIFDTVRLAGANVSQASLHNLSNIDRLVSAVGQEHLFEGDQIVVSRRNDVIPYVEEVLDGNILITQNDPDGSKNYEPPVLAAPDNCPHCGTALVRNGEHLMCPNDTECPAQVSGLIKVWVKKIGLKGVGGEIIDFLCEQGIVNEPADLYALDEGELADMTMNGRRIGGVAKNVVTEIKSKMDLPLHVLLGSLNIPLCSRSTLKKVVDAGYETLADVRAASQTRLASIDGMGDKRATNLVNGLKAREAMIDRLLANGITIQAPSSGPLKGKTICMTGFRDSDLTDAIEKAGGTVKSGVSKNLSILVAKDKSSSSGKMKKAADYGCEILDVEEMWVRLGGRP